MKTSYIIRKYLWAAVLGFTLALVGITVPNKEYWIVFIPTMLAVSLIPNKD